MKCQMCSNEILREFKAYFPKENELDEEVDICGHCNLLIVLNENIKRLVDIVTKEY